MYHGTIGRVRLKAGTQHGTDMEYLEPWHSAEQIGERIARGLEDQIRIELPRGHILYGITIKLLARGNGDDALFELLDGSGRVADVHLTWSKSQERLPWPGTDIYRNLKEWREQVMVPEYKEWQD